MSVCDAAVVTGRVGKGRICVLDVMEWKGCDQEDRRKEVGRRGR